MPLFKLYTALKGVPPPLSDNSLLYDQYFGIFLINVVFQLGLLHLRAQQLHEDAVA